jgi:hypothetical protein
MKVEEGLFGEGTRGGVGTREGNGEGINMIRAHFIHV